MALPKLDTPLFNITLPVSKQKITYRPFLVKEEKILMMAKEGGSESMLTGLRQILEAVIVKPAKFDMGILSMPDIEFLFVQIRARSVQNIVELKYRDKEDQRVYDFEIDLDELEMTFNKDHNDTIVLDGNISIKLNEPTLNMMETLNIKEGEIDSTDNVYKLLYACTDRVFDADEVYDDFTEEEFSTFIKSMDITMFSKLKDFFETGPKLIHELKYVNKEGNERSIKLEGISDFF
jgi:hypothetical protein|tara:strand:- start:2327 stop:3031 length:705 start_codon:yes stop_codon:yes gene_type:complete